MTSIFTSFHREGTGWGRKSGSWGGTGPRVKESLEKGEKRHQEGEETEEEQEKKES